MVLSESRRLLLKSHIAELPPNDVMKLTGDLRISRATPALPCGSPAAYHER